MPRSIGLLALALLTTLAACGQSADQQLGAVAEPAAITVPVTQNSAPDGVVVNESLPMMTVHKSPSCGCCGVWIDYVKRAGFPVRVVDTEDVNPLKIALGVPPAGGSCHTAVVDGYFIEGHVPLEDIQRLLSERPAARGLTVPGMVTGSPGMEVPSGEVQPYTVYLVDLDGNSTPYSHHGP